MSLLKKIVTPLIFAGAVTLQACSPMYASAHDPSQERLYKFKEKEVLVVDSDLGPIVLGYNLGIRKNYENKIIRNVSPLSKEELSQFREEFPNIRD